LLPCFFFEGKQEGVGPYCINLNQTNKARSSGSTKRKEEEKRPNAIELHFTLFLLVFFDSQYGLAFLARSTGL
jgi:hypothetical protein